VYISVPVCIDKLNPVVPNNHMTQLKVTSGANQSKSVRFIEELVEYTAFVVSFLGDISPPI